MELIFHFKCTLKCRLQFVSIWTSLKFCHLVMGLRCFTLDCVSKAKTEHKDLSCLILINETVMAGEFDDD